MPSPRSREARAAAISRDFFLSDRLIIDGGIGEAVSQGIGHHFQQVNDGGNLAGSQPLYQLMGLLFFVPGCHQE